jgi:hypothetical protein
MAAESAAVTDPVVELPADPVVELAADPVVELAARARVLATVASVATE